IVEVAVLHHHLRVHEVALRPLQLGAAVVLVGIADPHQVFAAPVAQFLQPVRGAGLRVDHPPADVRERPARPLAGGREVAPGGDVGELVLRAHRLRAVVVGVQAFVELVGGSHFSSPWGREKRARKGASSRVAALAAKASTSGRAGTPVWAPARVQASAAAAAASAMACGRESPRARAAHSTPQNVSPAPVVSSGSTANAACTCRPPSGRRATAPAPPRVTTTAGTGTAASAHAGSPIPVTAASSPSFTTSTSTAPSSPGGSARAGAALSTTRTPAARA